MMIDNVHRWASELYYRLPTRSQVQNKITEIFKSTVLQLALTVPLVAWHVPTPSFAWAGLFIGVAFPEKTHEVLMNFKNVATVFLVAVPILLGEGFTYSGPQLACTLALLHCLFVGSYMARHAKQPAEKT